MFRESTSFRPNDAIIFTAEAISTLAPCRCPPPSTLSLRIEGAMNARYAMFAVTLSIAACDKQSQSAPAPGAATAAAATSAATTTATATTGAAAAPGQTAPGPAAGTAATPSPGGTVVAANNHGKVLVNDAGVVTARRANGDSVVTNPNGVTTANGVVVDKNKGTVVVPGVGTFATPPGTQ